jgi:hypothetical protein
VAIGIITPASATSSVPTCSRTSARRLGCTRALPPGQPCSASEAVCRPSRARRDGDTDKPILCIDFGNEDARRSHRPAAARQLASSPMAALKLADSRLRAPTCGRALRTTVTPYASPSGSVREQTNVGRTLTVPPPACCATSHERRPMTTASNPAAIAAKSMARSVGNPVVLAVGAEDDPSKLNATLLQGNDANSIDLMPQLLPGIFPELLKDGGVDAMKSISITRKELYDRVWQEPMMRLAKSFGLSDVGLAKICRKNDIPRPPRGYWARMHAGQSPPISPLPSPEDNPAILLKEPADTTLTTAELDEDLRQLIHEAEETEVTIDVRDSLRGAHALVSRTNELLAGAQANDHGLLIAPKDAPLALKTSKASLRRALLVMDAVVRGLVRAGYEVTEGPSVILLGVPLSFSIEEQLERKRQAPEEHDLNGYYSFGHSRFNQTWSPSSRLTLRINEGGAYWAHGCRYRWSDGEKSPLEKRLSRVFPAMLQLAAKKKEHEAEVKRREEEQKAEEVRRQQAARRRAEKRQAYRAERARFRTLIKQAKGWKLARDLRLFIEAARHDHIAKHGSIEPGGEFANWLDWARWQANRLDPFCESDPSILDEDPKQFEDPRPKYLGSWYSGQ